MNLHVMINISTIYLVNVKVVCSKSMKYSIGYTPFYTKNSLGMALLIFHPLNSLTLCNSALLGKSAVNSCHKNTPIMKEFPGVFCAQ